MTFVQVIEYETTHPDEMDALLDEWLKATEGKRASGHGMHTRDRDRPDHYVNIVEFDSHDSAMRNSQMPETQEMAQKMRGLCSADMQYLNLDVLNEMTTTGSS